MQKPTHPDVHTYYDHTRFDYRTIWNRSDNLAVHFGYYDEQADKHHDALNNMNRVLADLAGIQPGERVLDAGCGMGGACFWLAEHRKAVVTGISVVESQIADCRKNALKRHSEGVDFVCSDYCQTPFPDASFDVIWACESVCHAADKQAFYREAARLLKPGGRLVMAEYMRSDRPVAPGAEYLLKAWLLPWAIPDIDTRAEHVTHARAAGFIEVEIKDVTPQVRVSLRNLHHLCVQWLPWGRVLRFFRIVNEVRLNNVRASIRQFEALEQGGWFYGMMRAEVPATSVAEKNHPLISKKTAPFGMFWVNNSGKANEHRAGAFFALLALLLLPVFLPAQTVADSLARELATAPRDTHRVSLLVNLAWEINESATDEAAAKLEEAINLAQSLQDKKGEAFAWNAMGVVEEIRGNLTLAQQHYRKALEIRTALGDMIGVASLHNNLANTYETMGRFDEAMKAHRESLKIVTELHDTLRMARSYLNMAGVYEAIGVYPEAYDQVNAARLIFEARNDSASIAKTLTMQAHIRFELEMFNEARRLYHEALQIKQRMGDPEEIAGALSDLGNSLDEMKNKDSTRLAVSMYLQALQIRKQIDDQQGIAALYNNLGVAHKHLELYDKAMDYLNQSLKIRSQLDDRPGLVETYNSIGDVMYGKKQYKEALDWTQKYYTLAQEIPDTNFIQRAYKDFAKLYAAVGNYALAYEYQSKYNELRFKRLDENRTKVFEQKEVLFSEGKKELEIQRRKHELEINKAELARTETFRNALLGGAVLLFLLVGLLFNRNRIRARANRELADKNEVIQQERERADRLLTNILPAATAQELILHNKVKPVRYESVTVMFTDFKSFTKIAETVTPEQLVAELDECFRLFDSIIEKYGLEKIKTIGDAYMCAGGLPVANETHAVDTVRAALEMQSELKALMATKNGSGRPHFEMRVGIHTGPVVAGVVGSHKFAYDIWGDTVNTAARMEQGSEPGKINISETTYLKVKDLFTCTFRGKLMAKNKGEIEMYFVEG